MRCKRSSALSVDTTRCNWRPHRGPAPRRACLDDMGVDPVQLGDVPLRRAARQVVAVEPGDQLLAVEQLVVAVAPAQARQVVDHRVGQVAGVFVLHDADRAVALGELVAVGPEDHRHVAVLGQFGAERAQDVDLARRVVHVVVAADHVADLHVPVVDDDAEVVGRRAVGARDDQVVEFVVADRDRALDHVVPGHVAIDRIAKAHHRRHALRHRRQGLAGSGRQRPS